MFAFWRVSSQMPGATPDVQSLNSPTKMIADATNAPKSSFYPSQRLTVTLSLPDINQLVLSMPLGQ